MRPLWSGSLTFGLVNIPVKLYSAVRATERVSFRQLSKKDLSPIRYERVSEKSGEQVAWKDIIKGYEYTKGKFVAVTDEELKAAAIEASKTIEILDFAKSDEIDPRYFETPYYLAPGKGGDKAYALLRDAINATASVGIGKISMRANSTVHLAGVKAVGDALVLETMRFAHELVPPSEFKFPGKSGVRPQELEMAQMLVENLSRPFDASRYTDEYHANLMKIIRAKMKGKKLDLAEPEDRERTQVVDLVARLQESLALGKKRGAKSGAKKTARSGRTTSRRKSA